MLYLLANIICFYTVHVLTINYAATTVLQLNGSGVLVADRLSSVHSVHKETQAFVKCPTRCIGIFFSQFRSYNVPT
jgi:hypothetical protein